MTQVEPPLEPDVISIIENVPTILALEIQKIDSDERVETLRRGLLKKIEFEALDALRLAKYAVKNSDSETSSHSSILVIARSLMEAVGLYTYIFIRSSSEDEKVFHCLVYAVMGLSMRQEFKDATNNPVYASQLIKEKKEIDDLKLEIQNNSYFISSFTEKQKKSILAGSYRYLDKSSLPDYIGFGDYLKITIYPFLSDYSHSGFVALRQVATQDKTGRAIRASLNYVGFSAAMLIHHLENESESVRKFLNGNAELSESISVYVELSQKDLPAKV